MENYDRRMNGNDWQQFLADSDPADYTFDDGDIERNIHDALATMYAEDFTTEEIATIAANLAEYATAELEAAAITASLNSVMTSNEVATAYNIDDSTVRHAIRNGRIPARQSGKTWLVRREDAEALWG